MKKIVVIILVLISNFCLAQTTINKLQISIITCSPGNELYSIFGHTAIRIIDSTNNSDVIYNYGTFDFEDPNFLIKFTRGKLDYFLSTDNPANFFEAYREENRTITEQILVLRTTEKNNIQQALIKNLSGNNKYYKYDFLFDNCTTRIRDLLKKNTPFSCNKQLVASGITFRNMLYIYLDSGRMCWSKLGIDLLLGSKIDKATTIEQSSFLPDYLMIAIDSFNIKQQIVADKKLYKAPVITESQNKYLPLTIFSFLFFFMLFISLSKNKIFKKTFNYFSLFLVFITGIVGCLLLFMWFGTDHKSCGNNYNLLWALPTNIIFVFFANKKSNYVQLYFKFSCLITVLLLACWFVLPQQFNIAFLPLSLTMLICYKKFAFNKIKTL